MNTDSEFVKAISAEITKRNLGLREAAQVVGTSHPTLGRALAGDKVTFEFAVQIASFLHLSQEASVRLAGLLPPAPESTAQTEQLLILGSNRKFANFRFNPEYGCKPTENPLKTDCFTMLTSC